ncbi:MAG: hypothetical protein JXA82_01380 [Sedimentisphaerales bacterium]|nr:hypothetical protein [Sedimentisphaerales bacterium]
MGKRGQVQPSFGRTYQWPFSWDPGFPRLRSGQATAEMTNGKHAHASVEHGTGKIHVRGANPTQRETLKLPLGLWYD